MPCIKTKPKQTTKNKETTVSPGIISEIQPLYFCTGRTRTGGESPGSDPTAASGGRREGSEWPRSVCNAAPPWARRTPGTATGHLFN